MTHYRLLAITLSLATVAGSALTAVQGSARGKGQSAVTAIPGALKAEHGKLHAELAEATKIAGATGQAATRVAAVLHEHFKSEEEFALPPLGLLSQIAQGRAAPEMREVTALTDRLKAEMPRMLREHKAILQALAELDRAARTERHPDVTRFVEELTMHAQTEEQALYPAAIVVGEYLKVKFPAGR